MSMQNVATKTNPLSVIERYKPVAIYEGAYATEGQVVVEREFPKGVIIDHLLMSTGLRKGCTLLIEAYIDGEWTEIYGLMNPRTGAKIPFKPINYVQEEDETNPEDGGYPRATNNLWDVVEYDTSISMYILKLKNVLPIYCRCRIKLWNSSSVAGAMGIQFVGRELL